MSPAFSVSLESQVRSLSKSSRLGLMGDAFPFSWLLATFFPKKMQLLHPKSQDNRKEKDARKGCL